MLNTLPSDKQLNNIIYEIESKISAGSQSLKKFWDEFPKNNSEHPDTRADYRRTILQEWIQAHKSQSWASLLISSLEKPDYKTVISMLNTYYLNDKLYSK